MNPEEARQILLLYRPETADGEDPQVAEALLLAKADAELARWFAEHCERQRILRDKFRQLTAPAGLLEQIVSEQAAHEKMAAHRRTKVLFGAFATVVGAALIMYFCNFWSEPPANHRDYSFANYEREMSFIATSAYGMNLVTNDPAQIRAYLAQNKAPADYHLPAPLEKIATAGCAVNDWNGQKVSMICFRTGQPLPAGQQSDLWLFVVDSGAVPQAPTAGTPTFGPAGDLYTASWTDGNKLYLLGTRGDEAAVQKFLGKS